MWDERRDEDEARLGLRQDVRAAQQVAIHEPRHEPQVLGARTVHLAHDALGHFAVYGLPEDLTAVQHGRRGNVVQVHRTARRAEPKGIINQVWRSLRLERQEGVDYLVVDWSVS